MVQDMGNSTKRVHKENIRMKKILSVVIVCIFLWAHGALAQDSSAVQATTISSERRAKTCTATGNGIIGCRPTEI